MQQIRIILKSYDIQYLFNAMKHIIDIANHLSIDSYSVSKKNREISINRVFLPKKIKKITVIRSPHIDKKSREQFEIRRYKNILIFNIKNRSTAFLYIDCIKNSQIYGVELSVNIHYNSFYSL